MQQKKSNKESQVQQDVKVPKHESQSRVCHSYGYAKELSLLLKLHEFDLEYTRENENLDLN